jgi:hypothetical protein
MDQDKADHDSNLATADSKLEHSYNNQINDQQSDSETDSDEEK